MTLRSVLRSLALSTLGLATTVAAQNRLEPQGKPPQAAPAPGIAEAIEQLQAKDWIRGLLSLQDLARDQQQEVLEAVAPLAHPDRDPDTIGRARAAILLLAAAHERREKRDELQKQFRKANDAADDLQRAIGDSPSAAEKKALASLQAHLAALKKQVDAEGPLAPTPLRVPVNRAGRGPKPPAPASGSGRSDPADGYEKVEVDGKTFLVPKNNLPANGEYEAEMTEQGLVIKPKKKGEAKPDPKPPATKPAAGTGDKQP